ncbi:MAG: hypothetical protein ABGX27_08130 [Desulfurobacteriaceae bacterium]
MRRILRLNAFLLLFFLVSCNNESSSESTKIESKKTNLEFYATSKLDLEDRSLFFVKYLGQIKTDNEETKKALKTLKGFLEKKHSDVSETLRALNYLQNNGKGIISPQKLTELKNLILKLISYQQPVFS